MNPFQQLPGVHSLILFTFCPWVWCAQCTTERMMSLSHDCGKQAEMELQIENGKPADGSDADSETEGQWLAQMAVVFKDRPKALAAQ